MENISISKTYSLVWQVKYAPHYKVSKCGRIFNAKTCREIKRTVVGGSYGFCINGKFTSLKKLRNNIELLTTHKTPF